MPGEWVRNRIGERRLRTVARPRWPAGIFQPPAATKKWHDCDRALG
jgi:hypothetical protein